MWRKIIFLILLLIIPAYAENPPTQLYDEGVKQGVIFNIDCVGSGIVCTKSGVMGTLTVSSGGSSLWTANGNDIYYNIGNVGIGTTLPSSLVDLQKTSASSIFEETVTNVPIGYATSSTFVGIGTTDSSVGTLTWASPTNIYSTNSVYSTATPSGTQTSYYLKGTNFGFSIPSDATIVGVVASVVHKAAPVVATTTFSYTGGQQTFSVPAGVTSITADISGAGGGNNTYCGGGSPRGARVQTTLAVTPSETLYIYVGGRGTDYSNPSTCSPNPAAGGYNGGGNGRCGAGGGGASDIRQSGTALANRIAMAGGAGGEGGSSGGCGYGGGSGGNANNPNGNDGGAGYGCVTSGGGGGTQSAGGVPGGTCSSRGTDGAIGVGGTGGSPGGAGGGGGYYGGSGGSCSNNGYWVGGGGGGGSSYSSGTSTTITGIYNSSNGSISVSYNSPGGVTDSTVKLVKGGTVVGDNKASGTAWALSDETFTYGSSTSLWGTTLTPADVNASDFGIVLSVSAQAVASVDSMALTIYYTRPESHSWTVSNRYGTDDGNLQFTPAANDTSPVVTFYRNGNVGVGTTTPNYKLDVNGIINGTLYQGGIPVSQSQWTTVGSNIYYNTGNVSIGTTSSSNKLDVVGNASVIGNVLLTGNLGIGTTDVTSRPLTVTGNVKANQFIGDGSVLTGVEPSVAVGTTAQYYRGDKSWQTLPTYTSTQWSNNGNKIYYNTDNVGIGSSNPSQKLSVVGNQWMSGYDTNLNYTTSKHYTGFPNRTDTTLAFVPGVGGTNRTFTLSGTNFKVWINGAEYNTTATLTNQLADVTGLYWLWITESGGTLTLNSSTTAPGFDKCLVGTVYWNTTTDAGIVSDERHWMGRDQWMHEYLHETVGARYYTGMALTLGGSPTGATFSMSTGEMYDEDLEHELSLATTCRVLYKNGSANWEWDDNSATLYKLNGGAYRYNNANALADVTNAKFVAMWVFATNNSTYPYAVIIGQREDNTIALARTNNTPDSISYGTLPSAEMKLLYRLIYKQGTGWQETADYRAVSNLPVSNYTATDHSTLSNLAYATSGHTGFEPEIAVGTTAQFWRGDKTWQTVEAGITGVNWDEIGGDITAVNWTQLDETNLDGINWDKYYDSQWTTNGDYIWYANETNTGNVGIGVTEPEARLHIKNRYDDLPIIDDLAASHSEDEGEVYMCFGTHNMKVYSYKYIDGVKYFSTTYETLASDYVVANFCDPEEERFYIINWSWTPTEGVDGYRILYKGGGGSYNYDAYFDIDDPDASDLYDDGYVGWQTGNTVTPTFSNVTGYGAYIQQGRLGINDSEPEDALSVVGTSKLAGHIAVGADSSVDTSVINITETVNDVNGAKGLSSDLTAGVNMLSGNLVGTRVSVNGNGKNISYMYGSQTYASGAGGEVSNVTGAYITASGAVKTSELRGLDTFITGGNSVNKLNQMIANNNSISLYGGNIGNAYAARFITIYQGGGGYVADNAYGAYFENSILYNSITNYYGLYLKNTVYYTPAEITNYYGIYQAPTTTGSGGLVRNAWFIYNNSTMNNYLGAGFTGIGTAYPMNALQVVGGVGIGTTAYNVTAPTNGLLVQGSVGIGTTNISATNKLQVGTTSGNARIGFTNNTITGYVGVDTAGAVDLAATSNHPVRIETNDVVRMYVASSGNIGIGTSTPSYLLDVVGQVGIGTTSNSPSRTLFVNTTTNRVGIGTTNPTQLLEVNGKALVNGGILKRQVTYTDAATVTINCDTTDTAVLTSLSQTTNFANPTGTPTDGQLVMVRVKSSTTRSLTWGANFRGSDLLPLPTATTGSSKTDYFGFIWNSADSKWDALSKNTGF